MQKQGHKHGTGIARRGRACKRWANGTARHLLAWWLRGLHEHARCVPTSAPANWPCKSRANVHVGGATYGIVVASLAIAYILSTQHPNIAYFLCNKTHYISRCYVTHKCLKIRQLKVCSNLNFFYNLQPREIVEENGHSYDSYIYFFLYIYKEPLDTHKRGRPKLISMKNVNVKLQ